MSNPSSLHKLKLKHKLDTLRISMFMCLMFFIFFDNDRQVGQEKGRERGRQLLGFPSPGLRPGLVQHRGVLVHQAPQLLDVDVAGAVRVGVRGQAADGGPRGRRGPAGPGGLGLRASSEALEHRVFF